MNKRAAQTESCQTLLAYLHAAYQNHWTAHWQSKGSNFYADHELFGRLYGSFPGEIDGLAEKMVAMYGTESVDLVQQTRMQAAFAAKWAEEPDLVARAYMVEEGLQDAITNTVDALDESEELTLGMDNFLAGLADSHETPLYLLGQRMKDGKIASRVASRYMK